APLNIAMFGVKPFAADFTFSPSQTFHFFLNLLSQSDFHLFRLSMTICGLPALYFLIYRLQLKYNPIPNTQNMSG
ncbi:hypothetical protein ACR71G_22545, partial [Xenorhabdus bovienii]|uniref:hypothetical protein n=1 Tax=Xenorhabdus bovienii TaxID=40576 RepID=UPI003DA49AF8